MVRLRHLRWRGLATAAVLATATHGAHGITISVTNLLDADDFGVPAAVISGVLNRAAHLWQVWLPSDPLNQAAGHPQNAQFDVLVGGDNIDATGANPANTLILPMARPTGDMSFLVDINSAFAAVTMMYWDATPESTTAAEFSIDLGLGAGKWKAVDGDLGFGKFDMLTVLLHEFGHGLGFSRDYSDFSDWVDATWNPAHPDNSIGDPAHFSNNLNLMSNAAGLAPDGKGGRNFVQPEDAVALNGAFGYRVPEPSTLLLLVVAWLVAGAARVAKRRRRSLHRA